MCVCACVEGVSVVNHIPSPLQLFYMFILQLMNACPYMDKYGVGGLGTNILIYRDVLYLLNCRENLHFQDRTIGA